MNAADEPPASDSRPTEPHPEKPRSVRGEIHEFFGVPGGPTPDKTREREEFDKLLADLEGRILGSLRKPQTPPPEIGPFILEEPIGRGGFAVVYRATHKRTGARAAVKLVPASDLHAHQRIVTEVESLIRLRHPNIVRVIDTGEDAGFAWVATDLIPGITLSDFIRTSRSPAGSFQIGDDAKARRDDAPPRPLSVDSATVRLAITWFRDLAGALDALHAAGLIHRDVKPANILIDFEQRPFLIDFGLSSSADRTVDGILAGTVPYMSPEQTLGGWVAITPKSDVYSLAATFHEVLTGVRITHGAKREAMLREIAFVPVAPPSKVTAGVPASLDPIFASALAKDDNQRYGSAKDLAEDLDRWLEGRRLLHVTEPGRVRIARFARKNAAPLAMILLLSLAGLAWATKSYLASERDYHAVLDRIRSSLDGGDPVGALSMLATNAGRFGGRSDFVQTHREAVRTGGEPFAREMLKTQAFNSRSLDSEASHRRFAEEARIHLEQTGIEDPYLIMVVALSKELSFDHQGAKAELDRHREIVDRTRLLTELEGIVSADLLDGAAYDAVLARLKRLPGKEPTAAEIGLRTFRLLCCKDRFPTRKVDRAEMDDVERSLRLILRESDHAFARMMLTLVNIDKGDYRAALTEIQELGNLHSPLADEAGTMAVHAAVCLVLAGQTSGAESEQYMEAGTRLAKNALEIDRSHVKRFVFELSKAELPIRLAWIDIALDEKWVRRPPMDSDLLVLIADALNHLARTHKFELMLRIARKARAQPGFDTVRGADDRLPFEQLSLWASRLERERLLAGKKATEVRALAVEAREAIVRLGPSMPYVFVAEDALAAGHFARSESDPGKAIKSLTEAMILLRNATDPGVVADALKRVPDEDRNDLANLREGCLQELAAVEEVRDQHTDSR
jgi:serine/threonine protein kinase